MSRSSISSQTASNNSVTMEDPFEAVKSECDSERVEGCIPRMALCLLLLAPTLLTAQANKNQQGAAAANSPVAQCDPAQTPQKDVATASGTRSLDGERSGTDGQMVSQSNGDSTKRNLRLTGSAASDPVADPQPPQCRGKDDDAEHWRPKDPSMSATPAAASEVDKKPPLASLNDGKLTITAHDAPLGEVLEAIQRLTGIAADIPPGGAEQRIFDNVGPAPVREVLVKLLDGTNLNYVIVSSAQDPRVVKKLILTAQTTASQPVQQLSAREAGEQADGPTLYGAGFSNDAAQTVEPNPPANGIPTNVNIQQAAAAENKTPGQILDELQKKQIKQLEDQAAQAAQNAPQQ